MNCICIWKRNSEENLLLLDFKSVAKAIGTSVKLISEDDSVIDCIVIEESQYALEKFKPLYTPYEGGLKIKSIEELKRMLGEGNFRCLFYSYGKAYASEKYDLMNIVLFRAKKRYEIIITPCDITASDFFLSTIANEEFYEMYKAKVNHKELDKFGFLQIEDEKEVYQLARDEYLRLESYIDGIDNVHIKNNLI